MKPFHRVVADTYALFKQILDDSNKGRYDVELWQYCSLFTTPEGTAREVRYVYDLCRLAHFDPQDKIILDAGCGFGRLAFVLMLMGAQKVCGIDLYENRLYTLQRIIQDYNLSEKLEAFLEDVAQMHYASQTFDMVLSVEAISHYEPTSFYERGQCPCEPISGSRAEYAFDPRELVRMIADYGFETRYYAYSGVRAVIRLYAWQTQLGKRSRPSRFRLPNPTV